MSECQSLVTRDFSSHSVLPNIIEKQIRHHVMYKFPRSYIIINSVVHQSNSLLIGSILSCQYVHNIIVLIQPQLNIASIIDLPYNCSYHGILKNLKLFPVFTTTLRYQIISFFQFKSSALTFRSKNFCDITLQ